MPIGSTAFLHGNIIFKTRQNTLCEFCWFACGGKWKCRHFRLPYAFAEKNRSNDLFRHAPVPFISLFFFYFVARLLRRNPPASTNNAAHIRLT